VEIPDIELAEMPIPNRLPEALEGDGLDLAVSSMKMREGRSLSRLRTLSLSKCPVSLKINPGFRQAQPPDLVISTIFDYLKVICVVSSTFARV